MTGHGQTPLVLASASPRRRALLEQIGVLPADVVATDIDETPYPQEVPLAYARRMAVSKAQAIAGSSYSQSALILAADTVVAVGRRILPKAETESQARACLELISGRGHRVITAVCLRGRSFERVRVVTTRVAFKRLSENEIKAYLESGEWQGKAGGYAVQGMAQAFVQRLVGSYSGVVGLPLFETAALLTGAGYPVYAASSYGIGGNQC